MEKDSASGEVKQQYVGGGGETAASAVTTPSRPIPAQALDATPLVPATPQPSMSLEEMIAENERLRNENSQLRQTAHVTAESMPQSVPHGAAAESPRVMPSAASPTRAASASLEPRSRGRPFNIRTWTGNLEEQKRKQAESPADIELGEFADQEAEAQPSTALVGRIEEPAEKVQDSAEEQVIFECGGLHSWIPQHSISSADGTRWPSDYAEMRSLLEESVQSLAEGDAEGAFTKFEAAFQHHLTRHDQPHLSFSAALLSYFGVLKGKFRCSASSGIGEPSTSFDTGAACSEGTNMGASQKEGDASPEESDNLRRTITQCAVLLRRLMSKATFGERPPKHRPAGVERAAFVRELTTQFGLSLDLVRLSYADKSLERSRRQKDRHGKAEQTNQAPIVVEGRSPKQLTTLTSDQLAVHTRQQEAEAKLVGEADKVRDLLKRQAVVGRSEAECHLKRAGHYLAACQMDMELVHAGKLLATAEGVHIASIGPHVLDTPIVEVGALGLQTRRQNIVGAASSSGAARPSAPAAAGSDLALVAAPAGPQSESIAAEASAVVASEAASLAQEGFKPSDVDPVVTPTYGQFVDLHVLPLYQSDIPFVHLKILFAHYCGLFLDSDDEAKTWKRLRIPHPRTKSARQSLRSRQVTKQPRTIGDIGSLRTKSAMGESPVASQTETASSEMPAVEAAARTKLRAQMASSVVEKRRHSMRAPGDMAAPAVPKGRLSMASAGAGLGEGQYLKKRKLSMASTIAGDLVCAPRTPEVSLALLQQPSTPIASKDAPTPVTLRRPTKPSEAHWLSSPVPSKVDVDWGLLETPKAKRRLLS